MIFFALIGLLVIAAVLVAAAVSLFLPRYGETDAPTPDRTGGRQSISDSLEGTPPS